jgi:two-component system response regulator PhoP
MRLLLIEDEPQLLESLYQDLKHADYSVDTADNGRDGLYLGLENPYDIAVIDIGLPEINGIDVIKQLRDQSKDFPILILTARDNWQDCSGILILATKLEVILSSSLTKVAT